MEPRPLSAWRGIVPGLDTPGTVGYVWSGPVSRDRGRQSNRSYRHESTQRDRGPTGRGGETGGGGGFGPAASRTGGSGSGLRLAATGAVLVALTAPAAPPGALAQTPTCTSTPSVTGTPSGTPNTWSFGGTYTSTTKNVIKCDNLTAGLTLTVETGAEIGTAASPAREKGIFADAENDGDNDLTITNSGTIRAGLNGISVWHNGDGLLKVEHKAGRIVVTGADSRGISVNHEGKANTKAKGIHIVSAAEIDLSSATNQRYGPYGILGQNVGPKAGSDTPIRIEMTGGVIKNPVTNAKGVGAAQHLKGDITIAIAAAARIGTEDSPIGEYGVFTNVISAATAAVGITNAGMIYAADDGIHVQQAGTGDVTVTNDGSVSAASTGIRIEPEKAGMIVVRHNAGGRIAVTGSGANDAGIGIIYKVPDTAGDRGTTVESAGDISAPGAFGILAWHRNHADATTRKAPITVHVRGGTIEAGKDGVYAATLRYNTGRLGSTVDYDGGRIAVTVDHGATVTAKWDGIYVNSGTLEGGMRAQTVIVRGRVMGGDAADDGTKYAGVHMSGGGTVVIGPMAHVGAASGVAVKANAEGDMAVILEKGVDGFVGHVDGTVLNTATTTFRTRTGQDADTEMDLPVGGTVDRRGEARGVYDPVQRIMLTEIDGGHEFREHSQLRRYHARARLYEALPSVLLDLVRPASPAERASVTRDGAASTRGTAGGGGRVWARLEAGDGKRRPGESTTGKGYRGVALAWDTEHRSVEAGLELPAGDRLALGLGVRHLRGRATVKEGGRIDVSGLGLGLSVAHTGAGGLYIDGRLSHTRFGDIDLASDARGSVASNLSGDGFAAGVGVGRRIAREGVALTPRGGLAWSSVSLGAFDDVAGAEGGGRVVPGRTRSLVGGLGVLAEFGGSEGSSGRAFASLDLEREFAPDREAVASGAALSSKARATWVRLGLGGALDLDAAGTVRLSGQGHYATAGSGNTGYGGSVSLTLRF